MNAFITFLLALVCMAVPVTASCRTVTCFLDGAKVEYEAGYSNGYIELNLPNGVVSDSLRIKPADGADILRVARRVKGRDGSSGKENAALGERRKAISDKIKTLEAKERIFAAAAKSQSGRALRKSKNNPDPLTDIRRGTTFAVSQLESVMSAKQNYEKELARLDQKLSIPDEDRNVDGEVCEIWFSEKKGRVRISYITTSKSWKPVYDFRLDGKGSVRMIMRAEIDQEEKGATLYVVPCNLSSAESNVSEPTAVSSRYDKVGENTFAVDKQVLTRYPVNSLSFTFVNGSVRKFPPGEASCYLQGEYLGGFAFKGALPGESLTLSAGKLYGN